jgi:Co/Zn/Cd efflux system component
MLLGNDMRPPHTGILVMMLGVYFLLIVLRIDWRIAIAGAVAFGLSTNFMDQVLAGHSTKLVALGYAGPVLAGVILAFRGKVLTGGAVTALALGLQMYANHLQITYYTLIVAGIFGLFKLVEAIQKGEIPTFAKAAGIIIVAGLLAFGSNASRLWTTYEYSQESIRGKSELTQKAGSSGSKAGESGLSKDYAFNWSYGIAETYTLLIPSYMGFSSNENFVSERDSETLRALQRLNNPEQAQSLTRVTSKYWGAQPFAGAPVYIGAIIWFLFFLGAFLIKKPIKYWIITATVLTIMMGWGDNFKALNYFLFDYMPMYNKFRAVTMVYGITTLLAVMLAMMGLQAFLSKEIEKAQKQKALYLAGGIAGGLALLALLISGSLAYGTDQVPNLPAAVEDALIADRSALLRADALRSLGLIVAAFAALWVTLRGSLKPAITVIAVGLLILIDMWGVARRIVNTDSFVTERETAQITAPGQADQQVLQDPDLHYRVADFRQNPFASALTSYHHKSMGGYHAAKLMRYQELIECCLQDPANYDHVYGMLNAKYFIGQQGAQMNPKAMGNAWFVPAYELVADADAEYAALGSLQPGQKAIIQQQYGNYLEGLNIRFDSTANIRLTAYHPDTLTYQYSANSEQLALFSEVYYPPSKGWQLYLNGEKMEPFIKANFILRAARLPAGQNQELKMIFEPRSYYTGEKITLASSLLILLLGIGGLALFFRQYGPPEANQLPAEAPESAPPAKKAKRKKR